MSTPTPPGPVGHGLVKERDAIVYVLRDHLQGRPYYPTPRRNAAEMDLEEIYLQDRLALYPQVRDRFEERQMRQAAARRTNKTWALDAIDALYRGVPIPGRIRLRYTQVLQTLVDAGPAGANRKEICRRYGIDGGRVSAAMTNLHDAGVIFPLQGVKR